jgi:hypothetical protein
MLLKIKFSIQQPPPSHDKEIPSIAQCFAVAAWHLAKAMSRPLKLSHIS